MSIWKTQPLNKSLRKRHRYEGRVVPIPVTCGRFGSFLRHISRGRKKGWWRLKRCHTRCIWPTAPETWPSSCRALLIIKGKIRSLKIWISVANSGVRSQVQVANGKRQVKWKAGLPAGSCKYDKLVKSLAPIKISGFLNGGRHDGSLTSTVISFNTNHKSNTR